MSPLGSYRVLDLTDERGLICGQILGDLGADVIAVEPPSGNAARRVGPFGGERAPETSLTWAAYSRNKRSVVIDITSTEGREQLCHLVEGADFFVESFDPGYMESLGLSYDDLAAINPQLVYTSVSAFGQDGPKAHDAMTDLTTIAASGTMPGMRDPDRAPLRIGVPQSFLHAGGEAADATLIAHYERQRSGHGQHVDVSAQQALPQILLGGILRATLGLKEEETPHDATGGTYVRPVKDGYVIFLFNFGAALGRFTTRLFQWMYEEGACDEAARDTDWIGYGLRRMNGEVSDAEFDRALATIEGFIGGKTKEDLFTASIERRLLIGPVSSASEINQDRHLAAREYWQDLHTPSLGQVVRTPGPFAKLSATPIQYRYGAPSIGQHTEEVLSDSSVARSPAPVTVTDVGEREALEGLKVLDFMWVYAGPSMTRVMADYGATVIKVESTRAVDMVREFGMFKGGEPGPDRAAMLQNVATGKLGLTLDLETLEGRQIAKDLVHWADVVTESFSPRAMRGWGLDYESLRKIKPDIIMSSICLWGQTGPYSSMAGFGALAAALGGFNTVIGWPDRMPVANISAYSDSVAPRFGLAAIMAAVDHRDRTGEGQYIDLSHIESVLQFLAPAMLDYEVNGNELVRRGNADIQMSPHAVLPAAGDDRWVAIACRDEEDWQAFLEVSGLTALAKDARFRTVGGRLEHREALEAAIAEWTRKHRMEEVQRMLQARGVPAHAVQSSPEYVADPQIQARGHFLELQHPTVGSFTIEGSRSTLSRTPARIERLAPMLGQHNEQILKEILGLNDEQVAQLAISGALG